MNKIHIIATVCFITFSANGQDQQISITVQSGKVVVDGKEREIGPGTFIPAPYDANLAKKIVDCNSEKDKLAVMLESCEKKILKYDEYWESRENKITEFYEKNISKIQNELEQANGWWNTWGKPVISAILSATVATLTTWSLTK